MDDRLALVTGASGYIGGQLVPALLDAGWRVRVLARNPGRLPSAWREQVEVVKGDATRAEDLAAALADVRCAYYLLHSMDGRGDYLTRDRDLAQGFARAAREAGIGRIVYLSGLHPREGDLSDHMRSRVEVGNLLLASGVPTAVLQAGVVLGAGSASFDMLRHLTERLPVAVAPRWLDNQIQPIAIDDVIHYLVAAADLPPDVNRTIDVAMDEVLTYRDMMIRYARITGLGRRIILTIPVLTPGLASHWVGLVTPVVAGVARPLVGSLIHHAVKHSFDASSLLGDPPGGLMGFDEAIRVATRGLEPRRWRHTAWGVGAGILATAIAGSVATNPRSTWYATLRKPFFQPPAAAFPVVWTGLYATIWAASTAAICELREKGRDSEADGYSRALAANLVLNAGWSAVFFRAHRPGAATAVATLLAASSADLARRAEPVGSGKAAALGAYAGWCAFATVLSGTIAGLNRKNR